MLPVCFSILYELSFFFVAYSFRNLYGTGNVPLTQKNIIRFKELTISFNNITFIPKSKENMFKLIFFSCFTPAIEIENVISFPFSMRELIF